ncbi:carbamoyltransferase HypF [bacterium]|nr:carbamoyltransferase HypF [bacterium]
MIRKRIVVQGIVQGVGFRPFVYNLANDIALHGFVINTSQGVVIELEGRSAQIETFLDRLRAELPPLAIIEELQISDTDLQGDTEFIIKPSCSGADNTALVPPDTTVCKLCLEEFNNSLDRRYQYPFINCTHCGPRYTLIKQTPYDRALTTMDSFKMCSACQAEYDNPRDRRFHAQPNACPECGPRVWLADSNGVDGLHSDPIHEAAQMLKDGRILAIKGLGGFHLACDAMNHSAVSGLRAAKVRDGKPFAVMAAGIDMAKKISLMDSAEQALLEDRRRPIVLLKKNPEYNLAPSVSPDNSRIGVMLPYTPLHHRLLSLAPSIIVMTSGNKSDEPIAYQNEEAVARLGSISHALLLNDRIIHNRCDDSVFHVVPNKVFPIRRSRGYAPEPVNLKFNGIDVVAVGAHQKNTFCLARSGQAIMSPHIGDLHTEEAMAYFELTLRRMKQLFDISPKYYACDMHPNYLSTIWARSQNEIPVIAVQHHHAHIASVLAENNHMEPVIGVAMDGTGYGTDGSIWGGEILIADLNGFERIAHIEYVHMPGADAAVKQPWRMAVSYLYESWKSCTSVETWQNFWEWISFWELRDSVGATAIKTVFGMLELNINSPLTSSMGRLFDSIAALIGICAVADYEGQAAIMLEQALDDPLEDAMVDPNYRLMIKDDIQPMQLSFKSMIQSIISDIKAEVAPGEISRRFHAGIVLGLVATCCKIRTNSSINDIALSGGCFQNAYLLTLLTEKLIENNFTVIVNRRVPVNDGGLALGQAAVAQWKMLHSE